MAKVKLMECPICKKEFNIAESQYKYQVKAGRTSFYCSLSCAGKKPENKSHLKKVRKPFTSSGPRHTALKTPQEFLNSSMKEYIRRFKTRSKRKVRYGEVEVTIEHLVEVWNLQQGKCYFTDVALVLPRDGDYSTVSPNFKASVDRIDNEKGYINGNVRFVSHSTNNLRNSMSDESVYEFFSLIKQHRGVMQQ